MEAALPADAPSPPLAVPAPVAADERIATIDVVRGLAVLGILVMNIVEFAWPFEAYENPAYAGGSTRFSLLAWFVQATLFDGKMRALFSMLFGAGLVLIAERMQKKGQSQNTADLLLRRCLWLVPFGVVHRFGLQWSGDILYQYGLLGALAVVFRNLRPRTLIVLGICTLTAAMPAALMNYNRSAKLRAQAAEAAQIAAAGDTVPDELANAKKRWDARVAMPPKPENLQKEVEAMRRGYTDVFVHRWDYHHQFQSAFLYYYFVWDVLGMMLLGMGLMKLGFFAGRNPTRVYQAMLVAGGVAAVGAFTLALCWQQAEFSPAAIELRLFHDLAYPYSRALVGLAWASALILCVRAGVLRALTDALGAVGRMAFSCYILQTVCCTLLFFGYGFGLYGKLSRSQLMLVMLGVSLVQVAFSQAWLRWFRFGPMEWAWRSLTYWRWQPLRREAAA